MNKLYSTLISFFVLALVLVCNAEIDEDLFAAAGDEAALTDLLVRQSPGAGRLVAIIGQNGATEGDAPRQPPKRYGISKHQAFRFGKRLDSNGGVGVVLAANEQADGPSETPAAGSAGGDANLNKYLNKFLEKHKTSGIFRWGRK